ncbi:LAMI_0C09956g1_1 [Lachancea mirantina]|uniref:LAMI_0C09956g1_1 n=1 Tax=Lachancea mirantina TaxID=1230905 RepID=A0A1G4J5T8_9SACH|nr:LAMI_0C09956g1_1 [Lachancea mirantina]
MHDVDPLHKFEKQFQSFVENNPNVISATQSSSHIPESAKAVVVLSPLSLRHQFPRFWVSKAYKKTIVERPERLLACSMGIAAAITMYPALFSLKTSHSKKTSLRASHVLKVHGRDWPRELLQLCKDSDEVLAAKKLEVPESWNAGDIYLSRETIEALEGSISALELGLDSIFRGPSPEQTSNRAFVALRPPGHHSHTATPSGFCLLNNAHIAIEYASETYDVTHAVVLDFDLHHGDGTQDICWKRAGFKPDEDQTEDSEYDEFGKKFAEYPKVGYFSMHDINSFPTELGYATKDNIRNASTCVMDAHDVNIWNVHLQKYETEEEFVKLYQTKYRTIFAKADEFFRTAKLAMKAEGKKFKGLTVISAGFDASEYEQASMQRHGVNVPTFFYNMFTKDALKLAQMHSHGKVLSIMEGGYSDGAIASGVFSHLIGLQNQNWIKEWGSAQVVKEIVRGCKANWKPYKTKRARDVIRIWAEEVIKLGRAMIPDFEELLFEHEVAETAAEQTAARRVTRSKKTTVNPVVPVRDSSAIPRTTTPTPVNSRRFDQKAAVSGEQGPASTVPFVEQELHSEEDEEDDEDYVYDEELNQTFNRTVEDITIDDISRHLETLDLTHANEEEQKRADEQQRPRIRPDSNAQGRTAPPSSSSGSNNYHYKIPSGSTTRHLRNSRNSRLLNFDDSDISMISHISTARGHTTRSGQTKW